MSLPFDQDRLARWLGAEIRSVARLSGGAIQDNWALDTGKGALVLRTTSAGDIGESRTRAQEFTLLRTAFDAGVTVPEPLGAADDAEVIGRPFLLMRRIAGTAAGRELVKDPFRGGDREAFVGRLGRELARIHSIGPDTPALAFLGAPPADAAAGRVAEIRAYLDSRDDHHPAIEWALRWLELRLPSPVPAVLAHRDFRTGNYMVDAGGLTGVLDWEFAGWSDGHEDLGWLCARCWRFGADQREAGGVGPRAALYAGYGPVDDARVRWWEVMAHARWAMVALEQADRHLTGARPSLELALTGRIVHELEAALLEMTC